MWPIAAVLPAVPLTALPPRAADWIATAFVLACLAGALWALEVRDWRVYSITLLWPPVVDAYQTANVTLPLALLVALMWRYRDRRLVAGLALGAALALKFFLWPVVVWLAATGRWRAAAISAALAAASLLALLPFISLPDYFRLLRDLGDTFDGLSYTPYALLVDLGASSAMAHAVAALVGAVVLVLAWRRRSFGLAIAAALCYHRSSGAISSPSSLCHSRLHGPGSTRLGSSRSGCGPRRARSTAPRGRQRSFSSWPD